MLLGFKVFLFKLKISNEIRNNWNFNANLNFKWWLFCINRCAGYQDYKYLGIFVLGDCDKMKNEMERIIEWI